MFLNDAVLQPSHNGIDYTLVQELKYITKDSQRTITVPKGFITDLASTPKLIWNIFPPFGKYTEAAIVHDWLYRNNIGTRKAADNLFLVMMEELGVGYVTRYTIYWNVRWFGWSAWNSASRTLKLVTK